MNKSGKELTDVRKNGNLRWLRPDDETQVQIPRHVARIQLQPRDQIVEVLIVQHFVEVPQL